MKTMLKKVSIWAVTTVAIALTSTSAIAQISSKQAAAFAKRYAGGGVVTDIDYKGRYYEVDVHQKGGKKHEIKINAQTGKKIAHSVEFDD